MNQKCARPGCDNPVREARRETCSFNCYQEVSRLKREGLFVPPASDTQSEAQEGPAETFEQSGNEWKIHLRRTRIKTLEELLEYCEVDTLTWEVERFVVNKWELGAKDDATGKIQVEPLFQVKATLKKRPVMVAVRDEIEALKRDAAAHMPRTFGFTPRQSKSGNLLEICIFDLHVLKLCWSRETGHENYDSKIARECFERSIETILGRASGFKIDRILYPVGNDLLHIDNPNNTTFAGTRQDSDSRYFKGCQLAREMQCEAIEKLASIAPVDVLIVAGNHDETTAWHIGDSLSCWFRNAKHVNINNEPVKRKYYEYGQNMIMLTHGDKEKHTDYPELMAGEQPAMWARTKFRECHTGHLHQQRFDRKRLRTDVKGERRTQEIHGTRVRIIPSLTPPDAWHSFNGYCDNLRSAEGFVWSKQDGLLAHVFHTEEPGNDE